LLSKELITHAVYSKHADLCQCSREEEEWMEGWRRNGVKKKKRKGLILPFTI